MEEKNVVSGVQQNSSAKVLKLIITLFYNPVIIQIICGPRLL